MCILYNHEIANFDNFFVARVACHTNRALLLSRSNNDVIILSTKRSIKRISIRALKIQTHGHATD